MVCCPTAGETDAVTDRQEVTATETVAQQTGDVYLLYSGDEALTDQPLFDVVILDEQGFVLDEQPAESDSVRSQYVDLLQLSDFTDHPLVNAEHDEVGSGEELLINLTDWQPDAPNDG